MSRFDNKPLNIFFKTLAQNLELAENFICHQKNMVVEYFYGSDETLKVAQNYDLGFAGEEQPMHGCNLESSLLSNFFIGKYFIVQMFRK